MKLSLCPCSSNKPYNLCCRRFHNGNIHPLTAEALMRSRYSAYVKNNTQYIYRTWDENTRPSLKVLREESSQSFTCLQIMNTTKGNQDDETGTVEFIASYTLSTDDMHEIHQHHENSYFIKRNNRWLYVNEKSKIDVNKIKTNLMR